MSATDKVLDLLRQAGTAGVLSGELRYAGVTGNPSQRIRELTDRGYTIKIEREHRDGKPGCRYTLIGNPVPDSAGVAAVVPGRSSGDSGGAPGAPAAAVNSGSDVPRASSRAGAVGTARSVHPRAHSPSKSAGTSPPSGEGPAAQDESPALQLFEEQDEPLGFAESEAA